VFAREPLRAGLIQRKAGVADRPRMAAARDGWRKIMAEKAVRDAIRTIIIPPVRLEGLLGVPEAAKGVVLFAHGSGSGRLSPRNNFVAQRLRESGLATMLFDLLTVEEADDRRNVFDIPLLAQRLSMATACVRQDPETTGLDIGYFGASTGAAAALVAAAAEGDQVAAIVSRGGRPDLAGPALAAVKAPTLLIVGGDDDAVLSLNRAAYAELRCKKHLAIVPGATHLFEEPGALEAVVEHARLWFLAHLSEAFS
jgi:pimeloyl-ACP methyl ester carboxylesterase